MRAAVSPEIALILGGRMKPLSLGCYQTGYLVGRKAVFFPLIVPFEGQINNSVTTLKAKQKDINYQK